MQNPNEYGRASMGASHIVDGPMFRHQNLSGRGQKGTPILILKNPRTRPVQLNRPRLNLKSKCPMDMNSVQSLNQGSTGLVLRPRRPPQKLTTNTARVWGFAKPKTASVQPTTTHAMGERVWGFARPPSPASA